MAFIKNNQLAPVKPIYSSLSSTAGTRTTTPNMSGHLYNSPSNMTPARPQDLMTPARPQDLMTPAQTTTTSEPSGNVYTIQSGDTLSGIAARNNMSLDDLLSFNPQYQANPNLIRPGDTVNFGSTAISPTQPAPTVPFQPTEPAQPPVSTQINADTGGVTPPVPDFSIETNLAPNRPPLPQFLAYYSTPQYQDAFQDVANNLQMSPEEIAAQEDLNRLGDSFRQAYTGEGQRAIPLEFITGRQRAVEQRALDLAEPIQRQAALAQAKRQAALDVSKFKLDTLRKQGEARESARQFDIGVSENARQFDIGISEGREERDREYDFLNRKFNEDVRQFGLNYALDQFQVGLDERGISLDEAKFYADQSGAGQISPYQAERSLRVLNSVDDLMDRVNNWTVGRGAALQELGPDFLASGQFRDFRADLEELSANIAFNELNAMKKASKTGGALGQVSERELALLQSALGGLRQDQTPEGFRNNLQQIRDSIERFNNAVQQYGGGGSGTITTPDGLRWRELPDGSYEQVTFSQGGGGTPIASGMRTDRHNNPTAFTTAIAKQAGLREGIDYEVGDPLPNNPNLKTARLLGDPIATTIRVIDNLGFYTRSGEPRWTYIAMSPAQWNSLSYSQKANVIRQMYQREGGVALANIFNSYA